MAKKHNVKTMLLTIPEGSNTGYVDWVPNRTVLIYNIKLIPQNIVAGDTGLLEFLYNGAVVSTFGEEGVLLDHNDTMEIKFPQDDIVNLLYPLSARIKVDAVDSNGRKLLIWIQYKE
jgi:hypothetical protein